jgi:hypothetical protein
VNEFDEPSLAVQVIVGVYVPPTVGVPVMSPVAVLIESPVGSPLALYDFVAVASGSVKNGAIASDTTSLGSLF